MDDIFEILDDPDLELLEYIVPEQVYHIRPRTDHFTIWNDIEFYNRFRFSKATVSVILHQIETDLKNRTEWNSNRAISSMDKLLLTLRFLATGDFYESVGDFVGVHKTTAGRIIKQVIAALCKLFSQYVDLPKTEEDQVNGKVDFYKISYFPRVIGTIDCTHIKIKSPGEKWANLFRNSKGFFSLKCQVVCNAKLKIINLVCRWPGSVSNNHIFDNSVLKTRLENQEMGNGILLAGQSYKAKHYILTPIANPHNNTENFYNAAHNKTRKDTIYRLFGIWKRRFPILSKEMRCDLELSKMVVVACATLHNIAIDQNEEVFETDNEIEEAQEDDINENYDVRTNFLNFFESLLSTSSSMSSLDS